MLRSIAAMAAFISQTLIEAASSNVLGRLEWVLWQAAENPVNPRTEGSNRVLIEKRE